MSKYLALWYGGSNYAAPDPDRSADREYYGSIAHAGEVLKRRADNADGDTPCADEGGPEMHLYRGGLYDENGPDVILQLGPRGGVRRG